MKKRNVRIFLFSLSVIFVILLIGFCYWGYLWGKYSYAFEREEFKEFAAELKQKYSYVEDVKFYILKSGAMDVNVTVKGEYKWDEISGLFQNGILTFLRSDTMMNIIKEKWGDDPFKFRYPDIYVEIYDPSADKHRVRFSSSYYNTWDMEHLTEENITEYDDWKQEGRLSLQTTKGLI